MCTDSNVITMDTIRAGTLKLPYRLEFASSLDHPHLYAIAAPVEWFFLYVILEVLTIWLKAHPDPILNPMSAFYVVYLQTLYLLQVRSTMEYAVHLSRLASQESATGQSPTLASRIPLVKASLSCVWRIGSRHSSRHFEDLVILGLRARNPQAAMDITMDEIIHAIAIGMVERETSAGPAVEPRSIVEYSKSLKELTKNDRFSLEDLRYFVVDQYLSISEDARSLAKSSVGRRHPALRAIEAHQGLLAIVVGAIATIAVALISLL